MKAAAHAAQRPVVQLTSQQLYERDLAALQDAARLARLWDHALRASFDLGRTTGYRQGWLAGRDQEAAAWQAIITGYSTLIDQPTREELARRRQPSDDPCSTRCGHCSRCIRAAAVASNLARYGTPNFPGTEQVDPRRTDG